MYKVRKRNRQGNITVGWRDRRHQLVLSRANYRERLHGALQAMYGRTNWTEADTEFVEAMPADVDLELEAISVERYRKREQVRAGLL